MIHELLVDGEGKPRYPPEIHDDALAWLLLSVLDDGDELPPGVVEHLGRFAVRAGLSASMSEEEQRSAVDAYFRAHPIPAELRTSLEQAMRAGAGQQAVGSEAASLLGVDVSKRPLERKGPAPEGTVAAGPMARFRLK